MSMAGGRAERVIMELRAEAADKRRAAQNAGPSAREYLLSRARDIEALAAKIETRAANG